MKAVKSAAGAPGENSPAAKKNPIRRLLLIEDNPADARLLREMLDDPDWRHSQLTHIDCLGEAAPYLEQNAADLILLDLGLHDVQGLAAVQRAHALAPRIPLVVLTGSDDESLAVQALKEGAQDYLVKGQLDARALQRSLRYAIERKNMEEDLFAEKERAQVTLNSIADAVICTDLGGNITFLNQVAERLTGWPWREAAGRPAAEVFQTIDAGSRRTACNPLAVEGGPDPAASLAPNAVLIRRDGSEIPIEDSVAPIHDREGRTAGAVVVFRDVSAARAMARQIAHSAEHDFLTGLPNRMLLNDRIRQAIAAAPRHMKKVALLFLDLDGFKHINDSLGHAAGDQLLQSIARRLVDCVRGSDTVSRQGGDEFVILLPEVEQADDAAITARRLLQAVAEPQSAGMNELHVTASIGVSVYPDDGADAQTLIQNADTAMYQAKETGRHSYQFFKPAMNIRAMERQFVEEGLRRAQEREELTLHYQPKVDLQTGVITGAEALLRWSHPGRGSIAPGQFIPVAEDCGLIRPIGAWVLRQACQQARAWAVAGLSDLTMAVNVSAIQLRHPDFLNSVLRTLAETGMEARLLELELTESVLMKNPELAASTLQKLREAGVRIAIDDFGTGYSSLSYLKSFPIDTIKIDQSLIRQISTLPGETSIASAVISLGRSLKHRVIAEGVEAYEEVAFLQTYKCDEAQGYWFSRPVPPEQFAGLIARGTKPAWTAAMRPASTPGDAECEPHQKV